jgi:fatty acid desaturase
MIELAATWSVLRLAEYLRYRDGSDVYRTIVDGRNPQKVRGRDHWFQLAAMLANWCEIFLLLGMFRLLPNVAVGVFSTIFVAGRFRALQEAGHTALHLGFGTNKKLQRAIADWVGNYLLWKPDSERRFQSHCVAHHPQAGTEDDPNVVRLRRIGLVPGISPLRFIVLFFFPLTPAGLRETMTLMATSSSGPPQWAARLAVNGVVLSAVWWFAGYPGLAIYLCALMLLYPLYSWWSLLVEHRWFADADIATMGRLDYECTIGRRTVYGLPAAWLIRVLVCPLTDSFHLAHHLYPRMHWKYMSEVDRALATIHGAYAEGAHHGLVIAPANDTRSAIGDLYARLVRFSSAARDAEPGATS